MSICGGEQCCVGKQKDRFISPSGSYMESFKYFLGLKFLIRYTGPRNNWTMLEVVPIKIPLAKNLSLRHYDLLSHSGSNTVSPWKGASDVLERA